MEVPIPCDNPNPHHQFPDNDLPLYPELNDIIINGDDFELPFDVDFDFSVDDFFADDLLLPQPDPNSASDLSSDPISLDPTNPIFDGLGNNWGVSDDVNCSFSDPKRGTISSEESNFRGESNSPEIGSSKIDSGVYSGNSFGPNVLSTSLLVNDHNNVNDCGVHSDSSQNNNEADHAKSSDQNSRDSNSSDSNSSKCVSNSKRKKEVEDDHGFKARTNKFRRSNVNADVISSGKNVEGGGKEGFSMGGGDDEDDKKKARLIRNRESAHLSRQRKKQYVEELEDKVKSMMSTITDLNSKISYFMTENATLRQHLSGGVGVAPPAGMYPAPGMPYAYPWMPYPPPPAYIVKPQGSNVPLVPIPRLKPQGPVPAPKAKKSSERKTKKVASVSLIGLLFFMLLFGGLVPIVNIRYGKVGNGLVGFQKGTVFPVTSHGRMLQQSNSSGGGNVCEPLVASLYVPRNDKMVKIDGNLIINSVLASEKALGSHSSEETGLAIHGSYPPYPTPGPGSNSWRHPHMDRNQNGKQMALGSGSTDFTPVGSDGKLQQWFREGLAGPMLSSGMCTEVFQFDVSPTLGSIVPASSVANIKSEGRLNYTHPIKTTNRRILHGRAIPLDDHTLNTTKEHVQPHEHSDGLQSNKTRSSVVVSVLVDPREVGDGGSESIMGSKTLSRIFVVVLLDSVKYVTYSCVLPFMGSSSNLITT